LEGDEVEIAPSSGQETEEIGDVHGFVKGF